MFSKSIHAGLGIVRPRCWLERNSPAVGVRLIQECDVDQNKPAIARILPYHLFCFALIVPPLCIVALHNQGDASAPMSFIQESVTVVVPDVSITGCEA